MRPDRAQAEGSAMRGSGTKQRDVAYCAGGVRNAGEKTRCGNIAVKVE